MKIPDGWVLVPRQATKEMIEAGNSTIENEIDVEADSPEGSYHVVRTSAAHKTWNSLLAAAPAPPEDAEIAAGQDAPGVPGATYRLLKRFDWRETTGWARAEMLRGTEPHVLFEVAAGCVASVVLQVAGLMTRSQMREAARAILTKASLVLEDDLQKVAQSKKQTTILHNNIRVVKD